MAKRKPKDRNRIEVDTYGGLDGWAYKYEVSLYLGWFRLTGKPVTSKPAARRRIQAVQALLAKPLRVDWDP